MLKTSLFFSYVYNLLIQTYKCRKLGFLYRLWRFFWDFTLRFKGVLVYTKIHGFDAVVPIGHWYLLAIQNYPKFNRPLLYLFEYEKSLKSDGLVVVDVGSAVGDTVLFLESKYPGINNYLCIDGDEEYNQIIEKNLALLQGRYVLINSLVSDKKEKIGKIEKENPTTGTSSSSVLADADSIDNLLNSFSKIDLVKIDIDGFDGVALSGSREIIKRHSPSIIFEWNVPLFEKTKNDKYKPFLILSELGYEHLFWFDNFGNFLFYQKEPKIEEIEAMANFSLSMEKKNGYHYDIVALKVNKNFVSFIH